MSRLNPAEYFETLRRGAFCGKVLVGAMVLSVLVTMSMSQPAWGNFEPSLMRARLLPTARFFLL